VIHPAIVTIGLLAFAPQAPTPLTTVFIAGGLTSPVQVTAPPGDASRLFIVEQFTKSIRIVKNGSLLTAPFLFVPAPVMVGGEQGLLGMAFHPDYANNGYFYVNYTIQPAGATVIERYQVSAANPDAADPNSKFLIMTLPQPFSNHNGGMLAFSPVDGYLYIGLGDGGSGFDPQGNGQNLNTKLGKMLRIDVNTPAGVPYAVPPSNPFVGMPSVQPEIWAYGLRNPWRYSFDRFTGDLWIADVGQEDYEEVNFQSAASAGGQNYGWKCYEGNAPLGSCSPSGVTFPIYEYKHSVLPGCAIIGGYVYRGYQIADLRGSYFFSEWCKSKVYSFRYVSGAVADFQDRTAQLQPAGGQYNVGTVASFGEDAAGELYIVNYVAGELYQIVSASPSISGVASWGAGTPGCTGVPEISANSSPIIGNPNFKIRFTGGASNALGLLMGTDASNSAGGDPFGIGANIYLDPWNASEILFWDIFSNFDGNGNVAMPIPVNPVVVGRTYTFQSFWHWPLGNCQTPSGVVSSSHALDLTILP